MENARASLTKSGFGQPYVNGLTDETNRTATLNGQPIRCDFLRILGTVLPDNGICARGKTRAEDRVRGAAHNNNASYIDRVGQHAVENSMPTRFLVLRAGTCPNPEHERKGIMFPALPCYPRLICPTNPWTPLTPFAYARLTSARQRHNRRTLCTAAIPITNTCVPLCG